MFALFVFWNVGQKFENSEKFGNKFQKNDEILLGQNTSIIQ